MMKTIKLLAMAFCTIISATTATAQETAEEATVSTEKTWTFDEYAPIDNTCAHWATTDSLPTTATTQARHAMW